MSSSEFFEKLALERPRLSIKYMSHLATQIQDGPESAKHQAIVAKISGDVSAVERACDRADELREKFMGIAQAYFEQHAIIGSNGDDMQTRVIFDILERQPLSREYLMRVREIWLIN